MIYSTFKWNRKCLTIPGIFNRIFWNSVLTSSFDDINLLWKKHIERISVSYWTDISCIVSWPVIIVNHGCTTLLDLLLSWPFYWKFWIKSGNEFMPDRSINNVDACWCISYGVKISGSPSHKVSSRFFPPLNPFFYLSFPSCLPKSLYLSFAKKI